MRAILVMLAAVALAGCATVQDVIEACRWDGACLACEDDDAGEVRYCPPAADEAR